MAVGTKESFANRGSGFLSQLPVDIAVGNKLVAFRTLLTYERILMAIQFHGELVETFHVVKEMMFHANDFNGIEKYPEKYLKLVCRNIDCQISVISKPRVYDGK
jgi:hypothetical protein